MRRLVLSLLLTATGCTSDAPGTPAPASADSGADASGTAAGTAAGAVETRMVRDDSTSVTLPRLVLPARPAVEARVNAQLDSLSASLTCGPAVPQAGAAQTEYEARAAVTLAAHDVFSLNIHASYNCGGPYPTNDANLSLTFDLATGEVVPFDSLFRDAEADRAAIAGVLETTLSPAGSAVDEQCAEALTADALAGATIRYALGREGVLVQPEFPHAMEACAVESTIPYASLRAYARDGGPLARVADAQTGG